MTSITDIQIARAIIGAVGENHQGLVVYYLRGITWDKKRLPDEQKAQEVITHMLGEYMLNTANALWADEHDIIPDYIKKWQEGKEK